MTRLLLAFGIFMTSLVLSHGTLAGDSISRNYDRVPVALADRAHNTKALETFYGDVIKVGEVRSANSSDVRELLNSHQIELNDGEIFYPEEIEYLLVPRGGDLKAPHTPD